MFMNLYIRKKEAPMFWGFHGLWLLMPLLLFGRLFWLVILFLLVLALVRRFAVRSRPLGFYRHAPFYNPGMPPAQPSALEILRQRYARGEIDAVTFDQMRERLESSSGPRQQ
jgi:putative membrane protein